ncbi:MAG: SsrA-binding protein SmpB [Clostridiales bacterium]|nr:SsrA-binding protein SmpB [Clostridiales bacterium]
MDKKIMAENKRARFDYEILETYEAGIVLTGDEIKSVRMGYLSLVDCYGFIKDGECFLRNSYIKEYSNSFDAGRYGDNSRRDRKLLLHKLEIEKMKKKIEQDRLTLVPTKAYFVGSNLKVEIAIARGKKLYDKRETLKKKEITKKIKMEG